jgi:putative hemolysin
MEVELILIFIFILILVNGFFAASEMAIVSINKSKIDEMIHNHKKNAVLLKKIKQDSTSYLSTIQVAITLAGFLSSALAGSNLADDLIAIVNMPLTLSVILITFILSFITLVLGELVPKRIALIKPEKFALFSVKTIYITMKLTKPIVWLLSITTDGILKLMGFKQQKQIQISEKEIKNLIRHGHTQGLFQEQERDMLENIFSFDDIHAEAIMTPRPDVYAIDINDSINDIIQQIVTSHYSRILIYDDHIDNILGVIHIKDILISAKEVGFDKIDLKKLIREPYYVPTSIKINRLFKRMQNHNYQIAVLLDDYGGLEGIVTIEDLIEEIVGDIYDEYDDIEEDIKKINDQQYLVNGSLPIQDINRYLNVNIVSDSETLNGLIIDKLEYIPSPDEHPIIQHQNYELEVQSVLNNRIEKILFTIKNGTIK